MNVATFSWFATFPPPMPTTKKADEPVVQLATRVPASLLQRVKVQCVQRERTVQDFVREAITERLRRGSDRRD